MRTIVESVLLDTMYEIPSADNVAKVVIDKLVIEGENDPYFVYENQKK